MCAICFFDGIFARPTIILDMQPDAPTKGRIRNTPINSKVEGIGLKDEVLDCRYSESICRMR